MQSARPSASRRPRRRGAARQSIAAYAFIAPFLIAFVVLIVGPIVYAFGLSLFKSQLIGGLSFIGLGGYMEAFTDPKFWAGVSRVGLYFVVQVPIMLGLALFFALALDSGRVLGAKFVRLAIFLPYAIPGVVGTLLWGYLYGNDFGLITQLLQAVGLPGPDLLSRNNILGAMMNISTWSFVGYNMIVMYSALRAIPTDLFDSAKVDGAGPWRIAWSVKIPSIRQAILLCVIFSIIGSFQLFNEPSLLSALAPASIDSSFSPTYYAYNVAFVNQDTSYAAALAFTLGLIIAVVSYVVQTVTNRKADVR